MTNSSSRVAENADAIIVSSYSRADAIEDGVLVDVSVTAREMGFTIPVALTAAAWSECMSWNQAPSEQQQDERGRLWDVLWMLRMAIRRSRVAGAGDRIDYHVSCVRARDGQRVLVPLVGVCGPGDEAEPVITIMCPDED